MEDYQWYIPWPQHSTSLLSSSQLGSLTAGPRSPETTEILYAVLPSGDFMRCFAREITFVTCVCFPMHQTPSEKGSTLKEKNLLLRRPLFHKEGKTVVSLKVFPFLLTLCMLGNFVCFFLSSVDFLKINFFKRNLSGIPAECQRVWIKIRPDMLSGLIWVQTVCNGYKQMTKVPLARKELLWKDTPQRQFTLSGKYLLPFFLRQTTLTIC